MFDNFFAQVQDFASTQVGTDVTSWLKNQAAGAIGGLIKVGQPAQGNPGPGQVGSTPPIVAPATQAVTQATAAAAKAVGSLSPAMLMGIAGGGLLLVLLLSGKRR